MGTNVEPIAKGMIQWLTTSQVRPGSFQDGLEESGNLLVYQGEYEQKTVGLENRSGSPLQERLQTVAVVMVLWLLLTYGVTLVVTGSKIAEPLRRLIGRIPRVGYAIACPMCFGWWVGLGVSLLGVGPAHGSPLPTWMIPIADAFCASAWCWIAHVLLAHFEAEEM